MKILRWVMTLFLICSMASAIYMISPDATKDISTSNAGNLKYKDIVILTTDEAKSLEKNNMGMDISIDTPNGPRNLNIAKQNKLIKVTKPITTRATTQLYVINGKRWNTYNPQLKFVLRNDAEMTKKGLITPNVIREIKTALNTWDDASKQNLFLDSNTVTTNPTIQADVYNKVNTLSWKLFTNSCIAYSRTWYKNTLIDGYKTAVDSDIVFNTKYPWRTEGTIGADVQTIALHEMGHSLGLGDLYSSEASKQAMYGYYTKMWRTLGEGDKTGVNILYG